MDPEQSNGVFPSADLDGDGDDELLVASGSGYLHALGRDGKQRWQDLAGLGVTDVLVTGTGREARAAHPERGARQDLRARFPNSSLKRRRHPHACCAAPVDAPGCRSGSRGS